MEPIELIKIVNFTLSLLFFICYAYQFGYILLPFILKEKKISITPMNRYAVLISARNEEAVIGHLIESIKAQDYPSELIRIFVVADNCTDQTANAARNAGAIVYERFNKVSVGKGYALDFLLKHIDADYGFDSFDGYFVFDADNLLKYDYITQMNRTFSSGYSIVTSYRKSKNYGDNWISAGYALWFMRESKYLNYPRMLLGSSCAVSGTGFLFSTRILKNCGGWPFHLLTEDIEFTIHNVCSGERIGFSKNAVFYDEQPVKFSQSWNQRMRWSKGYLQVFGKYGLRLVSGIFRFDRSSFSCFDMCMTIMPAIVLTVIGMFANLTAGIIGALSGQNVMIAVWSAASALFNSYLLLLVIGGITTITEWKEIDTTPAKKILYTFTFPLFMMTYIPISFLAIFKKVEWTPIRHTVSVSVDQMERRQVS